MLNFSIAISVSYSILLYEYIYIYIVYIAAAIQYWPSRKGFATAPISERVGRRTCLLVGGFVGCVCLVICSFAPTYWLLLVCYSVGLGVALSLVYNPALSGLGHHFHRLLPLASSLVTLANPLASLVRSALILCTVSIAHNLLVPWHSLHCPLRKLFFDLYATIWALSANGSNFHSDLTTHIWHKPIGFA